ncbi:MAG TPA: ATP-binding protein [Bacteroidales bacterium]|nr:ATP-binding protein [Bacteroidales bacterium]
MQTLSHKTIALLISGIASVIAVSGIIVSGYIISQNNIIPYAIFIGLTLFAVVYIITFYITKEYIIQKVKPIYKTIHSAQTSTLKKIAENEHEESNIIATTEKEVAEWAKRKIIEIEELKRLEKYRKEYIGNVSHELKTPIFSIQGYISTLLDGGLYDESINKTYLEKADKAIQRMTSIVRDLDSITRLEAGELKLEYGQFNIIQLVKEVFEAQELLAKERKVQMYIDMGVEKPIHVHADKKRIQMALNNLVINAIKYNNPEGGKIRVRFYDMDNLLLVEVSDTGIGIEQEHLSRIFERFYRVDKSRSREQGGTGLGLSIVKHIIEAHGQTISVKSTINKGTSFTFTIEKAILQ